jgi:hypothetical protein
MAFCDAASVVCLALDQEDVNKVKAYLTSTGKDPTALPRKYWNSHPCIRRYLKQPGELVEAIEEVWHQWQSATARHTAKQGDLFTDGEDGTAVEFAKFLVGWCKSEA